MQVDQRQVSLENLDNVTDPDLVSWTGQDIAALGTLDAAHQTGFAQGGKILLKVFDR